MEAAGYAPPLYHYHSQTRPPAPVQLKWRGLEFSALTARDGTGAYAITNPTFAAVLLRLMGFVREWRAGFAALDGRTQGLSSEHSGAALVLR